MLSRITLSAGMGIAALVTPASAQIVSRQDFGLFVLDHFANGQMTIYLNPDRIVGCVLIVAVAAWVVGWLIDQGGSSECSCDECEVERAQDAAARHDREAARMRAQTRQAEAHTELTARLIDKARVDAEYNEIKQITDHDRKIRNIHRGGR